MAAVKQAPKPAASLLYRDYAVEQIQSLLTRLPDPDQVLEKVGLGRHELRKLETDDEISAALETRREASIATPWRLDPFEGEPVQFVWNELERHIDTLARSAWNAVPYGYTVQEVVYKRDGSRVGIDSVIEKPLEWFEPRRDGQLWYTAPNGGAIAEPVDTRFKFLLSVRNPTYRNPYGEAVLSRCYWPWFFRYNGWRFWMTFLERFADPLIMGQVYSPQEFVDALQGLGFSAVVGVGREETVSAVTQGQGGEFARVEQVLRERIQRVILGQTLTSQVDGTGSYAAAKVHADVLDGKRRSDIRLISGTAQTLVSALWTLNQFPGTPPTFIMQDDTGLEADRATRDATLVNAGILKFTTKYIQSKYDLEPDDFELPSGPATPSGGVPGSTNAALAQPNQTRYPDQEAIDAGIETLATADAKNQAAAEDMLTPIIQLVQNATTYEQVMEGLATVYPDMNTTQLEDRLARALFAADAFGRSTARHG